MDDERQGDATDARAVFGIFKPKNVEALLYGPFDSEEYFMKYPKRGKCLIFNHKIFDPETKLKERKGTDVDASNLYCRFRQLGFDTIVFKDFTVREVNDKLEEVGNEKHSDSSCFVCCILTHGDNGMLYARDGIYQTDKVFAPFRGDVCQTLVGKPKIFFIQACQGKKFDAGVTVVCKESFDSMIQFKIPTQADFLIAHSTVPGYYSWRNKTDGSWFIQELCIALREHVKEKDLLEILTIVNRRVAFDFESYNRKSEFHEKKVVPYITSTLTRNINFL